MKTTSQRGVALVVSLIMLGLVTMLAIAFIGITRRERHSVEATKKTTEAKLMADASLARAQTEVMERLRNNINLQLLVSINGVTADPRPPVVYNVNGQPDDRFFLNLNRDSGPNGLPQFQPTTASEVGDPQWIGVLEDPTQPHSADNRFIGRYAYMIVPASKAAGLDWMRNYQLAGLFHQLDASAGKANWSYSHLNFLPSQPLSTPQFFGTAFDDAMAPWLPNRGSSVNRLIEFNADVFNANKVGANWLSRLTNVTQQSDPYAFYKLAGSLSPDGGLADKCLLPVPPYITNKFNLNNLALNATNYFQHVADRLLMASCVPVTNAGVVKYVVGTTYPGAKLLSSVPTFSRIMVYPEYQYTPEVHRLLQVAVNITDAALNTGSYYPLVLRPRLYVAGGQVFIGDFVQEPNSNFLTNPAVNLPSGMVSVDTNSLVGIIEHSTGIASLPILIASKRDWPRPDPVLNLVNPTPPDPLGYLSSHAPSRHLFPNLSEVSLRTVGSTIVNVIPNSSPSYTYNVAASVLAETWNSTGYPSYLRTFASTNPVPIGFTVNMATQLSGSAQLPSGATSPFVSSTNSSASFSFGPPLSNFYTVGTTHPLVAFSSPAPLAPGSTVQMSMTNWVRYALVRNSQVVDYASTVRIHSNWGVQFPNNAVSINEHSSRAMDPLVNNIPEDFLEATASAAPPSLPNLSNPMQSWMVFPFTQNIGRQNPIPNQSSPTHFYTDIDLAGGNPYALMNFPSGAFSSVGELGRVHRGTPWQTIYFKSLPATATPVPWDLSANRTPDTHPTNDWRLPDLFTTAASVSQATGLLSVNNTNEVAWASVLSGLSMRTHPEDWLTPGTRDYVYFDLTQHPGYDWWLNQLPYGNRYQLFRQDRIGPANRNEPSGPTGPTSVVTGGVGNFTLSYTNPSYRYYSSYSPLTISTYSTNFTVTTSMPNSRAVPGYDLLTPIARSINSRRDTLMGVNKPFALTGQVLATPELTVNFPFQMNWSRDLDFESIPQQLLPLLRVEDEPIYIVYAWGQSLKPDEKSIVTSPTNAGFVGNYVVTGQVGTRTVFRVKNSNPGQPPRMVVESFKALP